MEQEHKPQGLGQIITQTEEKTLVSFKNLKANYDHIELTEEELSDAIHKAKGIKHAAIKQAAYVEKLNKPREYPKFTFESLRAAIIAKYPKYIIDSGNEEIFDILCMYFSGDPGFELQGDGFSLEKGIMIYGGIGCGKTTLMKMFAINSFRPFAITPCRVIADDYTLEGASSLYKYSEMKKVFPEQNYGIPEIGRCFDDLGTEDNKTNFGNKVNVMQDVFYKIYDNGLIGNFHVTTNIIGDDIEQQYGQRIRSRTREMFNVLIFNADAKDRRK